MYYIQAIDDKEFGGNLINLLQNGEEFITNNSKRRWKKTTTGRIEMPEYPERAVLECIVNALIHRDYLDLGSEVHIDMYDDRIDIYSPGGMYDGSQVQNLDTDRVPSKRRNPIIADIFNRMNYMERRGSGFKKIKGDYRKEINYKKNLEPKFYSDNSLFWVTLYNLNYNVPVEKVDFEEEKVDIELIEMVLTKMKLNLPTKNKAKEVFLKFNTQNIFSRKEVAELLEISPTSASNLMGKLNKAGLLKSVAGKGKGKYRFR